MIELRTALQAYLKTIHPRVFFQAAPKNAEFPYLVFDLPNSLDDGESQEVFVVDVDGWDAPAGGDTTALETLMASVDGNGDIVSPTGLNKRTLTQGNTTVTFYRDTRLALIDDDPRIRRRKYVYQARLFERSE